MVGKEGGRSKSEGVGLLNETFHAQVAEVTCANSDVPQLA